VTVDTIEAPSVDWGSSAQIGILDTPCYVFDPKLVLAQYSALKSALGTRLTVSLKANPNLDLFVRCSHAFVDGVELASIGELNTVVGRITHPKIVNTPAMSPNLMAAAIASRATLVFDSLQQVEMFSSLETRTPKLPAILRLSAAELTENPGGIGPGDHFGMDRCDALEAIRRLIRVGLRVRGLHVFAGSNTFATWSPLIVESMTRFLPSVEAALGSPLELVNLGGGFPDDWRSLTKQFAQYRYDLEPLTRRTQVYHEAGRAIFGPAGCFVTKILALKSVNGRPVAVCDGGLAQCFLLAQTESVIKRRIRPHVFRVNESTPPPLSKRLQVVGSTCSRADIIGELDPGTVVAPDDRLIFEGCGAYATYSPLSFLSLAPPNHYLIS